MPPITDNENIIFGTEAERLSVTLDNEQIVKDTTTGGIFTGDGVAVGGKALDARPVRSVTSDYTLVRGDEGVVLHITADTVSTITIPTNATIGFHTSKTKIPFVVLGTGSVSFAGVAGVTINPSGASASAGEQGTLWKTGTNTWWVAQAGTGPTGATGDTGASPVAPVGPVPA